MTEKERAKLKKIIGAIKIPRRCDIPTANAAYNSSYYDEEVIKPLEKLCDWNEEDEKTVTAQATLLKKEIENGKFNERFNRVKEFLAKKKWWVGGTVAALAAGISVATHLIRKKKNNNDEDKNTEK
ncbi:MAG: hypothetical protein QMD50_00135 [Patescibacteria group bacterium]|nr:hypothetical protein [Patescibacteria group bacterium]